MILYKSKDGRRILWKNINDQNLFKRTFNAFVAGIDTVVLSNDIGNKKPKLSKTLRNKVLQIYSDDTDKLENLIGKRITES